jgi:FKBP-type peptidyl-prolyl cis-trans isomerase
MPRPNQPTLGRLASLTDDALDDLWKHATVVPDTNVLLHIYRYSETGRTNLFEAFETVGESLWIPAQVAAEFDRRRPSVINAQRAYYDDILDALTSMGRMLDPFDRPFALVGIPALLALIRPSLDEARQRVIAQRKSHPDLKREDPFRERLTSIIGSRVGEPYSGEALEHMYRRARTRYEQKIPPGFADDKPEPNRYGDTLLWFQVLDHARETKKPVIIVTDDGKEDWWQMPSVEPRRELRVEIRNYAGVDCWLFTAEGLLKHAARLRPSISEDTIAEAREVREHPPSVRPANDTYAPSLNVDISKMTKTASGLYYKDKVVGIGAAAARGDFVKVNYTLWLTNGTKVESSKDTGRIPLEFLTGAQRVIPGFEEGVLGMLPGAVRLLVVPPQLAWGSQGNPPVQPNANIVFEIEYLGKL